jgi:hypothetical protein
MILALIVVKRTIRGIYSKDTNLLLEVKLTGSKENTQWESKAAVAREKNIFINFSNGA